MKKYKGRLGDVGDFLDVSPGYISRVVFVRARARARAFACVCSASPEEKQQGPIGVLPSPICLSLSLWVRVYVGGKQASGEQRQVQGSHKGSAERVRCFVFRFRYKEIVSAPGPLVWESLPPPTRQPSVPTLFCVPLR